MFRSKKQGIRRIKQGSDRNRTENERPKVTEIDYNTDAHNYFCLTYIHCNEYFAFDCVFNGTDNSIIQLRINMPSSLFYSYVLFL